MRLRWTGLVFLAFELLAQAQTRYVTDRTIVELRRGPSTEYLILRNLEAGERVEILEQNEAEGYSRVRVADQGTEGWILTRFLTAEPIARERLAVAERNLTAARERVAALEAENSELTSALGTTTADPESLRKSLPYKLYQGLVRPVEDVIAARAPELLAFQHVYVARKPFRPRKLRLTVGMLTMNEKESIEAMIGEIRRVAPDAQPSPSRLQPLKPEYGTRRGEARPSTKTRLTRRAHAARSRTRSSRRGRRSTRRCGGSPPGSPPPCPAPGP